MTDRPLAPAPPAKAPRTAEVIVGLPLFDLVQPQRNSGVFGTRPEPVSIAAEAGDSSPG